MTIRLVCVLAFAGCGTDTTTTDTNGTTPSNTVDGACATLCTDAGFDGGEEFDYSPVIECLCSGNGAGLAQDDCSAYCDTFGIGPDRSFLSTEVVTNDKCVCDGT